MTTVCLALALGVADAQITRVSTTAANGEANGASSAVSVSADGRYIAFASEASNLVANDTNGLSDVFVKDRETGEVRRVSLSVGGAEVLAASDQPSISDDGTRVAFRTLAALSPNDGVPCQPSVTCEDIYVRDLTAQTTTLVSVTPGGISSMRGRGAKISGNGRYVVFSSPAADLAAEPAGVRLYIRDLAESSTLKVPVAGAQAASEGVVGGISADGQVVAFGASTRLLPTNLDPGSCFIEGGCLRVYLYTRADGKTERLNPLVSNTIPGSVQVAPVDMSADGNILLIGATVEHPVGPGPSSLILFDRAAETERVLFPSMTGDVAAGLPATISRDGWLVAACQVPAAQADQIVTFDRRTTVKEIIRLPDARVVPCLSSLDSSHDGRLLFGASDLTFLVAGDTNAASDVFLFNRDGDDDGMSSSWETQFSLDPADPDDAGDDPDEDGLTNLQEFQQGSHPRGLHKRYLAEGASNAFFTTRLSVFNPDNVGATMMVSFLGGNRVVTSQLVELPGQRTWVALPSMSGQHGLTGDEPARTQNPWAPADAIMQRAPDTTFATVIESDAPLVAERSMVWQNDDLAGGAPGRGAHGETAVEAPQREWHFAEGATGVYNLFYLLMNPNDTAAHVEVTYLRPAPAAPITIDYTVPARSRQTIDVNAQPGLAVTEVAAKLTSDLPILAERSQYLTTTEEFWTAGHGGAAIAKPSTEWFVAEGATNFFRLYLVIENPETSASELTVAYLLPDGTKIEKPYTAAKTSRLTIDVAGEDPRLASTSVSMTITSTNNVPVVVERVMWWPADAPYEASVSAGATATATAWASSYVPIHRFDADFTSYLMVANPSDEAGQVTVSFRSRSGITCGATLDLLAHSRLTIDPREHCPDIIAEAASVVIISDGPEIVAERASYRSKVRVVDEKVVVDRLWIAGEAVALTPIPPLK